MIVKSYVCVFVSMLVKAVHLELVSDLSTESFMTVCCPPSAIWSNHSTNFVGANRILKELYAFLFSKKTEEIICDFWGSTGTLF